MGRRASRSGIVGGEGIRFDLEQTSRIVPGSGPSFGRVREKSFVSEEEGSLLELHSYQNREGSELPLLESALFSPFSGIRHAYATRLGGVSEGEWSSMNLSFTRGDREEDVRENFHRIAEHFSVPESRFVLSHQTHKDRVRTVTEEDAGKGLTRERDYTDVDALITDVPRLLLTVFWADCVPLLFYDPRKRAIGAVHSGWRGTFSRIASRTVEAMRREYGTEPSDLFISIGPSICGSCYEVSEELSERFLRDFPGGERVVSFTGRNAGGERKYHLNLREANRQLLLEEGVSEDRIELPGFCTCCNPKLFFSHRFSGERRGNQAAFLMLL